MSRSFKKEPIEKYGRFAKKINLHNKRLRRRVNQSDLENENLVLPQSEELTNCYDLCDGKYDVRKSKGKTKRRGYHAAPVHIIGDYYEDEVNRVKRKK